MYPLWVFIISGESAQQGPRWKWAQGHIFHQTNCSFLFQGMDYNTFILSCRILKCTQIFLFPSPGPHVSVPLRAPIFPFFQFRQTSCSQPRGPVTISLSEKKTLKSESATPPVGKFSGGIWALLILAIMWLIWAFPLFLSFLPLYKCLLEMQISVFWYFKHLNLFPQACSRCRVLYLFWDLAFSLNLPLLAVLLCLLAICSYQAK